MKYQIKKGRTSYVGYVSVDDSSSTIGAKLTGLVFNSGSLTAYYARQGGAATAITLATQTATGAYSSGGFVAVDGTNMPGVYRFDIPDAVLASGADNAVIVLKGATNMVPVHLEIELVAYDPQDAVRAGLTALPNANAEAAGGLITRGSGAGQVNQDANGRIDVNLTAWKGTTAATVNTAGVPVVDTRQVGRINTAQAGAGSTITLDAGAVATDNFYNGHSVEIMSGTGAGQGNRVITGYVGSTKVATVAPAWVTNPSSDSVFALMPAGVSVEAWLRAAPNALTSGAVDAKADVLTWRGTQPNVLASGRVDTTVGAMQTDVVTAAAIATDAIGSAEIAASGANKIRDAVSDDIIETNASITRQQAESLILAAVAGVTASGGNTLKDPSGTSTRIAATTDGSNNRTNMVVTPSA